MMHKDFETGRFYLGDCLEIMKEIPDNCIDMILCDLPYGTTQNKWDSVLDLKILWEQYWRILKINKAVILTAQSPFDKTLGGSCIEFLKYEWIWEKAKATGHLNSKRQPLKAHENILVFYRNQCTYNPQKTPGQIYKGSGGKSKKDNYGDFSAIREGSKDGSRYPRSVQFFTHEIRPVHPTQKPVALFEYLVRTYTNENDLILDNCAGSGTTAIAAINTNRKWVCIEKEQEYYDKSIERIGNHKTESEWKTGIKI